MSSEKGSTLITVLLALAVLSIAAMSIAPVIQSQGRQAAQANARISASILQTNLFSYFRNQLSWQAMVNDSQCNATLQCVKNGTNCAGAWDQERPIHCFYDSAGRKIFDTNVATNGFGPSSEKCNTYSATNPDANCPFRPTAIWKCQESPCNGGTSTIVVTVSFRHDGDKTIRLNMAPYGFEVLK